MKPALVFATVGLFAVAGCSSEDSADDTAQGGTSATIAVETPALPEPSEPAEPTSTTPAPTTPSAAPSRPAQPTATSAGDLSFCDYLAQSADAAQQVEDPAAFVQLVQGAAAVAPGSIREDVALYAESVRKLALTVTGSPDKAAKADAWLTRNDAAVQQAQDNLNSYSLSTCGQPFITGEGN